MRAADALRIELDLSKEIPSGFYMDLESKEDGKDRAAYEAMKAVQRYRRYLLQQEAEYQDGLDCGHDVCRECGAHLDTGETCDCRRGDA